MLVLHSILFLQWIPPSNKRRSLLWLEKGLNDGLSMADIVRSIHKHPTTVCKEVKKYRTFHSPSNSNAPLCCAFFKDCSLRFLCVDAADKDCVKMCKYCFDVKNNAPRCFTTCPEYRQPVCEKLLKAPFVCNGFLKARRFIVFYLSTAFYIYGSSTVFCVLYFFSA